VSSDSFHSAPSTHDRADIRDGDRVFETYWTTDRGNEALMTSYHALDLTVFGRQERWEDSPEGWPRLHEGEHSWRLNGRPIAQRSRTSEPVTDAGVPRL
jgi:hypothetical protein